MASSSPFKTYRNSITVLLIALIALPLAVSANDISADRTLVGSGSIKAVATSAFTVAAAGATAVVAAAALAGASSGLNSQQTRRPRKGEIHHMGAASRTKPPAKTSLKAPKAKANHAAAASSSVQPGARQHGPTSAHHTQHLATSRMTTAATTSSALRTPPMKTSMPSQQQRRRVTPPQARQANLSTAHCQLAAPATQALQANLSTAHCQPAAPATHAPACSYSQALSSNLPQPTKGHRQRLAVPASKTPTIHWKDEAASRKLRPFNVEADGNCQFRALAYLLNGCIDGHTVLRKCACDYMLRHPQMFAGFLADETLDAYVARMRQPKVWGDDRTLCAIANWLCVTIVVVQSHRREDPATVVHRPHCMVAGQRVGPTYYVAYDVGEGHYQALLPARNGRQSQASISPPGQDLLQQLLQDLGVCCV